MLGEYFSILNMENISQSSELKFFGEVYISFSFKNCFNTVVNIILQLVFHTLQVIHIIFGFVLFM
jgi:hypothetical protein